MTEIPGWLSTEIRRFAVLGKKDVPKEYFLSEAYLQSMLNNFA